MLRNRTVSAVLRTAAVITLGVSSAVALGAGPASARAFGCSANTTSSTSGYALCTGGTGIGSDQYRVALTCRHQGSNYAAYGPWKLPTQTSAKTCPYGSIYSLTVQHA